MKQTLFHCCTRTIPHLFLCYIDDCVGAVSRSHEELEQFISFTNTLHPNLKFTWTISDTSPSPSWIYVTSTTDVDNVTSVSINVTIPAQPVPLICLTELFLTLNNFSFNSSHFLQTKRVAMGTRMGPSYACLFVGYVEQSLFRSYTVPIPHLFLRYIDD
eukprot:g36375.t1